VIAAVGTLEIHALGIAAADRMLGRLRTAMLFGAALCVGPAAFDLTNPDTLARVVSTLADDGMAGSFILLAVGLRWVREMLILPFTVQVIASSPGEVQ